MQIIDRVCGMHVASIRLVDYYVFGIWEETYQTFQVSRDGESAQHACRATYQKL